MKKKIEIMYKIVLTVLKCKAGLERSQWSIKMRWQQKYSKNYWKKNNKNKSVSETLVFFRKIGKFKEVQSRNMLLKIFLRSDEITL